MSKHFNNKVISNQSIRIQSIRIAQIARGIEETYKKISYQGAKDRDSLSPELALKSITAQRTDLEEILPDLNRIYADDYQTLSPTDKMDCFDVRETCKSVQKQANALIAEIHKKKIEMAIAAARGTPEVQPYNSVLESPGTSKSAELPTTTLATPTPGSPKVGTMDTNEIPTTRPRETVFSNEEQIIAIQPKSPQLSIATIQSELAKLKKEHSKRKWGLTDGFFGVFSGEKKQYDKVITNLEKAISKLTDPITSPDDIQKMAYYSNCIKHVDACRKQDIDPNKKNLPHWKRDETDRRDALNMVANCGAKNFPAFWTKQPSLEDLKPEGLQTLDNALKKVSGIDHVQIQTGIYIDTFAFLQEKSIASQLNGPPDNNASPVNPFIPQAATTLTKADKLTQPTTSPSQSPNEPTGTNADVVATTEREKPAPTSSSPKGRM